MEFIKKYYNFFFTTFDGEKRYTTLSDLIFGSIVTIILLSAIGVFGTFYIVGLLYPFLVIYEKVIISDFIVFSMISYLITLMLISKTKIISKFLKIKIKEY